jgi:hypothetical protein
MNGECTSYPISSLFAQYVDSVPNISLIKATREAWSKDKSCVKIGEASDNLHNVLFNDFPRSLEEVSIETVRTWRLIGRHVHNSVLDLLLRERVTQANKFGVGRLWNPN